MSEPFEDISPEQQDMINRARLLSDLADMFCNRYHSLGMPRTDAEQDWFGFGDFIRTLTTQACVIAYCGYYPEMSLEERVSFVNATEEMVRIAAQVWERRFGRSIKSIRSHDGLYGKVLPIGAGRAE